MKNILRRGKSGTFYAVVNIPADVRLAFGGARQKWVGLHTTDEHEAVRKGGPVVADIKDAIRAARMGQPTVQSTPSRPRVPIRPDRAWGAIRQWRKATIDAAQVAAFNGETVWHSYGDEPDFTAQADLSRALYEQRWADIPGFDGTLVAALARAGIKADVEHPVLAKLRPWFGEAWREVNSFKLEFSIGNWSIWPEDDDGDEVAAPEPEATPAAMRLIDLYDTWIDVQRPKHRESQGRGYVQRLAEFLGDPEVSTIKKTDLDRFQVRLRDFPNTKRDIDATPFETVIADFQKSDPGYRRLSAKTIWGWFRILKGMFEFAADRDYVAKNPVALPKLNDDDLGQRLLYDDADIATLFAKPLFTGTSGKTDRGYRTEPGATLVRDAKYWLPILSLWHGCRVEELAAAKVADFKVQDGIHFLDLTARSLKNKQSQRRVPLHPKAIDLGFLDYVKTLPASGYVFPELAHDPADAEASSRHFTKWWGLWCAANADLVGQGFDDPSKTFHSFRHAFKRACRGKVEEEIHDLLTGHKGTGGVGREYGRGIDLATLGDAIAKVSFPTFPLSGAPLKQR